MTRTVITPDKNFLSFNIPDKYIEKKMEVIAFAVDEPSGDVIYTTKSNKCSSAIKLSTKGFKLTETKQMNDDCFIDTDILREKIYFCHSYNALAKNRF